MGRKTRTYMKDLQGHDLRNNEEDKKAQEGWNVDLVSIFHIVGVGLRDVRSTTDDRLAWGCSKKCASLVWTE